MLNPEFTLNYVFQIAHNVSILKKQANRQMAKQKSLTMINNRSATHPGRTCFCNSLACHLSSDPSVMDQEATPLESGIQPCLQSFPESETKETPIWGLDCSTAQTQGATDPPGLHRVKSWGCTDQLGRGKCNKSNTNLSLSQRIWASSRVSYAAGSPHTGHRPRS